MVQGDRLLAGAVFVGAERAAGMAAAVVANPASVAANWRRLRTPRSKSDRIFSTSISTVRFPFLKVQHSAPGWLRELA